VENVGGYRLVRKLGEGERAEVWLGHSGRSDGSVVAVKLFRSHVALRSIDEEIDALARASSRHLVDLRDIATAPDGRPCLMLGRLPAGSLLQLFARRKKFLPGEMVTAIVPIVEAVAELHRVGVAHGGVRAAAVLFDARHSPVLACFGSSRVIGPAPIDEKSPSLTLAQQANDRTVALDLAGLVELVRSFTTRVEDPSACEPLVDWLETTLRRDESLVELADRLYDVAVAAPLGASDGGRTHGTSASGKATIDAAESTPLNEVPGSHSVGQIPGWLIRCVNQNPLGALGVQAKAILKTVRRPVWIIAALGLIAFGVAIAVIPTVGVPIPSNAATPIPQPINNRIPDNDPTALSALTSDDPLAAAQALVSARASCIAQRSVKCLNLIDQAESAALEVDRNFIQQLQSGTPTNDRKFDATTVTLIERLGDSAIVGLGTPTAPAIYPGSVLIVKVGTAWRIRDLTIGALP